MEVQFGVGGCLCQILFVLGLLSHFYYQIMKEGREEHVYSTLRKYTIIIYTA